MNLFGGWLVWVEDKLELLIFKDVCICIIEFIKDVVNKCGCWVGYEMLFKYFLMY